jgi:glycosyltransferase 2 family protein
LKRLAVLVLGLLISAVSLYLALKDFDWRDLGTSVASVQPVFLLLMLVPYVLTFMTKVWRWRVLFHPDEDRFSIGMLFSSLMLSYIPLPFRAGEVARGVVASARSGVPAARVFSTIVLEKVLDVLTLLLLLGISLPFAGLPRELQGSATALAAVFLVVALAILTLVVKPDIARRLAHMVAVRLPERLGMRIESTTDQALKGLAPLADPAIAAKLGAWSIATWSINAVTVYFMLLAFNIVVTPMAAVTLVVATNLGMAVPSAPGYVGPFEFVVSNVLAILGVAPEAAKSFALVYHFIGLVPVAAIGVVAAIQQGVGMAAFRGDAAEAPVDASVTHTSKPAAAAPAPTGSARDKR